MLASGAASASAHPLGNFTVNRYARVEVSGDVIRIYYVLDEAEIPAFQERKAIDADANGFLRRRVAQIAGSLRLSVDGRALALTPTDTSIDRPPGQGGLPTLRVAAIYTARLPEGASRGERHLTFADRNEPDRVGWREIVTVARGGARIVRTDAPRRDVSDELRHYPGDLLQAPLDLRSISMSFVPGTANAAALAVPQSAPPPSRSGGLFASLITRQDLSPIVLVTMFGIAVAVGAGHALLPGHGKTVMAAYLVGTKGRPIDAVLLGVIVSLMHTVSVIVLGLILFRVDRSIAIDRYYEPLNVVSGLLAAALGVWLLVRRYRRYRRLRALRAVTDEHDRGHDHDHVHAGGHDHDHDRGLDDAHAHAGGHDHDHVLIHAGAHDHEVGHVHETGHEHDHDGEPVVVGLMGADPSEFDEIAHGHHHGPGGHSHDLPADVAPLSRRGLVLLATSGGVVPSPTAVIVVVSAFTLGRPVLGLGLIAAFSVGLAVTLMTVGLALVYGRQVIERRFSLRSFELLPTIGALTLIVLGLVLAIRGLTATV